MNRTLDIAIASGININYDKNIEIQSLKEIKKHTSNAFGAFISVKRSNEQALEEYPEDIHGCIGDWDKDYNVLPGHDLLNIIKKVSYSATWNDSRRKYFNKHIYHDSYANYEIDYMLSPVYKVDYETGIIIEKNELFNNDNYGLIADNGIGNRATYLRYVFKDVSWEYIRNRLINKSGSNVQTEFYCYESTIYKKKIKDYFIKKNFKIYYTNFITFMNNYYNTFIPYKIDNNNKLIIDKSQAIRNVATMNDILKIKNILENDKIIENIYRDIEYYIKLYVNNTKKYRQMSAFLLLVLNILITLYKDKQLFNIKNKICQNLYKSINNLEPRFERGEVLISLVEVCPKIKKIINTQQKMYKEKKELQNVTEDDIFQLNWEAKFLYSLNKFIKNNKHQKNKIHSSKKHKKNKIHSLKINNSTLNNRKYIITHTTYLTDAMLKISSNFNETTETNYLATAFEGLCSLRYLVSNKYKIKVNNTILYLFYLLQQKYEPKYGLYRFLSGDKRLDITGHIINGMIVL